MGRESTNGHAQKSRRPGVSMVGKPKRIGRISLSSEWMGESREWGPAESSFLLAEGGAGSGSGRFPQTEVARATGRGGSMVLTVSSLGSGRSGLGSCKPKVRAGPQEVLSSPPPPCREGTGSPAGPGRAEEGLTGSRMR